MLTKKAIKRALAAVLSAACVVTSLPVYTYAQTEQIEVGNTLAEEAAPEKPDEQQPVSGNDVPESTVSRNTAEKGAVQPEDGIAGQGEGEDTGETEPYEGARQSRYELARIEWNGCKDDVYVGAYAGEATPLDGEGLTGEGNEYFDEGIYVRLKQDCGENEIIELSWTGENANPIYDQPRVKYLSEDTDFQIFWPDWKKGPYVLRVRKIPFPTVSINVDTKYQDKVEFFLDYDESKKLESGMQVKPGSYIYAKGLSADGGKIPICVDAKEFVQNVGYTNVKYSTTVEGTDFHSLTWVHSDNITIDVRDGIYVDIIESESLKNGNIKPSYSYKESEGAAAYKELPEDRYVPEGSILKVEASGIPDANGEVLSVRVNDDKRYGGGFLYENGESVTVKTGIENNRQCRVVVAAVPTYDVSVTNDLTEQSKVKYEFRGKEFTSGIKAAKGDSIKVTGTAPSGKAVRLHVSGNEIYDLDESWTYEYRRYFTAPGEEQDWSSEEQEIDILGPTTVTASEVTVRNVTINKPEGQRIDSDVYFGGDYSVDFGEATSFKIPEGEYIRFEAYDLEQVDQAFKITRQNTKYSSKAGYLFCYRDAGVEVKDEDLTVKMELVTLYRLDYDRSVLDLMDADGIYRIWHYDDEFEEDGILTYWIPYGAEVSLGRDNMGASEKYNISAYHTGNQSEKLFENVSLTKENYSYNFVMPAFPVTVETNKEDRIAHKLSIRKNVSGASDIVVKKYNDSATTETVNDGDDVFEDQLVRVNAESVAENKKLMVTFKKTGTNEYVTGSAGGVNIEGVKSAFFNMFHFDTTIDVTEKDRKGSGKPVYISESVSGGTEISYNIESGDLAPVGQEITIDITKIADGKKVAVNVVCPDGNLVTSGSSIKSAYYSDIVEEAEKISFAMPDYPLDINIWETAGYAETVDISGARVTVEPESFVYAGREIEPVPVVWYEGRPLVEGKDFTVSYADNKNVGTAHLTVTGTGRYTGSASADFTIRERQLSDEAVKVQMADKVYYNRKAKYEPKPVVTIEESGFVSALTEGDDYILSYENNTQPTAPGVPATVKITGTVDTNMRGELTRTFEIVNDKVTDFSKNVTIKPEKESYTYTGEAIEPKVQVIYNNEILDPRVDYSLSYKDNVNAGKGVICVAGIGNYIGRAEKEFTIAPRSFDAPEFKAAVPNQKYRKNTPEYKPEPIITYAGDTLIKNVDYQIVQYENNTGAAAKENPAKVIIKGINNYDSGNKTFELAFCILETGFTDMSKTKIKVIDKSIVYNGSPQQARVEVTFKGGKVTEGTDYELIYQNNVNAGTAKVTVAGIGAYAGSKTATFKITPKMLKDDASEYVVSVDDVEYNGINQPEPSVEDVARAGTMLKKDKDVTFTYKNNKNISANGKKASVTIKGKGNYKGKITREFEVKKLNWDNYDFSVDDCYYTGKKLKPDIIATSKTTGIYFPLKSGTAVKVTYTNNMDLSREGQPATAKFSPKNMKFFDGASSAQGEAEFSIVPCDLSDAGAVKVAPVKMQKSKNDKVITPKLDVRLGTTKLKANKHYKVEPADGYTNKEPGIGKVKIIPADTEHFTGEQTVTFIIK